MTRFTIHFTGRVQGVGFRYTTKQLALGFVVAGTVQNLDDGRVLLVIEGEAAELRRFLDALLDTMRDHVRSHTMSESPATGEFGVPCAGGLRILR